jgi:exopolyphosphatase/guanosine-5'-triphosphate,3'-diphosphate pyrophosphatase
MRVGVIDVGANTARLLVADIQGGRSTAVLETRTPVRLGEEIERSGVVSARKIDEVAAAVEHAVDTAWEAGADDLAVLVTSPGRQSANGKELARAVARRCDVRVRRLTAAEEARLAYLGALSSTSVAASSVAVCDVGGGSAQIAVGPPLRAPAWIRSVDIGSLRLTRRFFEADPPRRRELSTARASLDVLLAEIAPPPVAAALATGGTARALQKLVGRRLGPGELAEALEIVSRRKAKDVERAFAVPHWRARLLPAGAVILSALQERLAVELRVARSGLREGAALELAEHLRVAA